MITKEFVLHALVLFVFLTALFGIISVYTMFLGKKEKAPSFVECYGLYWILPLYSDSEKTTKYYKPGWLTLTKTFILLELVFGLVALTLFLFGGRLVS